MNYTEFVDKVYTSLGTVNYGMLGRMAKTYKFDFILSCVTKVPGYVKCYDDATLKTRYLLGICKKTASTEDYNKKKQLNINHSFEV
jgi:hypothetical protein